MVSTLFLVFLCCGSVWSEKFEYNGEWDISAKETAILCLAAKQTPSKTKPIGGGGGDSVLETVEPISEPDISTYLPEGDPDKCWKNAWIPCPASSSEIIEDRLGSDGVLSKRRRPCGHYKMMEAPSSDCQNN